MIPVSSLFRDTYYTQPNRPSIFYILLHSNMAPSTPSHYQLTRDKRLQILTLQSLNLKYKDIAKHLDISIR
jgi:hypothetical protein